MTLTGGNSQPAAGPPGHLVLVVGPSGAGKDSLLAGARDALRDQPRFVFPRRIVTRRSDPASEDHGTLSEADFSTQLAAGAFFLHWNAHGLRYALPGAVADSLAAGSTVIANVSRQVINEARRLHPATTVVFVTAPQAVLEQRLLARGREDAAAVRRRLARGAALPAGPKVVTIVNDGPLEGAVESFLAVLETPAAA
ncbi:MAG: phosphonate metabolism protein/1,5-bisphosphokinase (PRPP-forming) PhnN [Kiloniellaceae bacterium]